ncbi:MAG: Rieske 2Fe-2S domain-containing protein [Burkholderiaceae bacterium]|jgi:nitrite reductase/ring-hydroxylating ferredoxin subunit|nr:Rieske 2Fe-2S domain-containing protein [Burkholderiaceae bacterium]
MNTGADTEAIALCASAELQDGALAVPFDVVYDGQICRAFAIRFDAQVHAYLNRCTHIAMEMDYRANHFFDCTGRWLLCSTHGAMYAPDTGQGVGGPCRGPLQKIKVTELDGTVYWHPSPLCKPLPKTFSKPV